MDINDPYNFRFYQVNADAIYDSFAPLSAEQMPGLLHVNNANAIRFYKAQSVTFSFGQAPLVDGPGPDLYIEVSGCLAFDLLLRQDNAPAVVIAEVRCPGWRTHHEHKRFTFDLQNLPQDVQTTKLELRTTHEIVDSCGLEIKSLCARVGQ